MRTPTVENKYHLTMSICRNLQILNRDKICSPHFWRNEVIKAWCITQSVGTEQERNFCDDNSFWIGVSDNDEVTVRLDCYGGICSYNIQNFYQPEDIECDQDLRLQEAFLRTINSLLDDGVFSLKKK